MRAINDELNIKLKKKCLFTEERIGNYNLPVGQSSEDIREARYEKFRKDEEHRSQKFSKIAPNKDLLCTSY